MKALLVLSTLALAAVLVLFATGASAAADTLITIQLTTDNAWDYSPQVSGDRVVWDGSGGTDGGSDQEIFTWTPAGGTVQLTTNSADDALPQVSGDAWCGPAGAAQTGASTG